MKHIKAIASLFAVLFLLSQCAFIQTLRFESRLSKEFRDWYNLHYMLMDMPVPPWIDARKLTERGHFLRLPEHMQRKYMAMFWEMREEGLKEVFSERVAHADRYFDEGRRGSETDRGHLYILLGSPDFAYMSGETMQNAEGFAYLIWDYWFRGKGIEYVFKFYLPYSWRLEQTSVVSLSDSGFHIKWAKTIWGPTSEGWDAWSSELMAWVKGGKKQG